MYSVSRKRSWQRFSILLKDIATADTQQSEVFCSPSIKFPRNELPKDLLDSWGEGGDTVRKYGHYLYFFVLQKHIIMN